MKKSLGIFLACVRRDKEYWMAISLRFPTEVCAPARASISGSHKVRSNHDVHKAHLWNISRAAFPELYPHQDSNGCNAARLEMFTNTLFDTSRTAPPPVVAAATLVLFASAACAGSPDDEPPPISSDFLAPKTAAKRDESQKAEVMLKSISDLSVASEGSSFAKLMWPRDPALLTSIARE